MTSSVYIAKSVYGGDSLGPLGDGRVVFVPGAFAGEQVKAEIVQEKKSFVKARLVEIEDASAERTGTGDAPIPGAVYWNLSVKGEKAAKRAQLAEFFDRNRIALPPGCDLSERSSDTAGSASLNYRNKVVYHFSDDFSQRILGYREEPSHKIVDITEDPLARPEINAKLPEIRENVFRLLSTGPKSVRRSVRDKENVTIRFSKRSGVVWWMGDAPNNVTIKEETAGKVFEVPSDGFYQVNPGVGDDLVKAVVKKFRACATREVVDLYCGVGTITLAMSRAAGKVIGVEVIPQAVEDAKDNAKRNGIENAEFLCADAGAAALELEKQGVKADVVVVDPPRKGLNADAIEAIARFAPRRLVYVSCDPATLARDVALLKEKGFRLQNAQAFDLFPRCAHVETVVTLSKLED